jgi:hypothetical protein
MQVRLLACVALALATIGCSPDVIEPNEGPVSATLTEVGGWISTPLGAAVSFPAGALTSNTVVTLSSAQNPGALEGSAALAGTAFRLEPAGLVLARPAMVELRIPASGDDGWLASIVNVMPDGRIVELGHTWVDRTNGIIRAEITELGTVVAVRPHAAGVVHVTPLESGVHAAGSNPAIASMGSAHGSGFTMQCGSEGARCSGISAQLGGNLLGRSIGRAALVYPELTGTLQLADGSVEGSVVLAGSLRAEIGGVGVPSHLRVTISAGPASSYSLSESTALIEGMRVVFQQDGTVIRDVIATVPLPLSADGASLYYEGEFTYSGESAPFAVRLPLHRAH